MRLAKVHRGPTLKPFVSSICRSGYQLFDSPASTLSHSNQRKIPKRSPPLPSGFPRVPSSALILDPRIKTQWLKRNIPEADEIINRIKTFLKEAYPVEPELLSESRGSSQKKKSLAMEYPLEYGSPFAAEDEIDRYFDLSQV